MGGECRWHDERHRRRLRVGHDALLTVSRVDIEPSANVSAQQSGIRLPKHFHRRCVISPFDQMVDSVKRNFPEAATCFIRQARRLLFAKSQAFLDCLSYCKPLAWCFLAEESAHEGVEPHVEVLAFKWRIRALRVDVPALVDKLEPPISYRPQFRQSFERVFKSVERTLEGNVLRPVLIASQRSNAADVRAFDIDLQVVRNPVFFEDRVKGLALDSNASPGGPWKQVLLDARTFCVVTSVDPKISESRSVVSSTPRMVSRPLSTSVERPSRTIRTKSGSASIAPTRKPSLK